MNMKQTLLAIAVSTLMGSAFAGVAPPGCSGDFNWNNGGVEVDLDDGWRAVTAAVELHDAAGCLDKKTDTDGPLCTKNKNLVTSSLDDLTALAASDVGVANPWNASPTDGGTDDTYAVVHMDIFMPDSNEDATYDCSNFETTEDGSTDLCGTAALDETCWGYPEDNPVWYDSPELACDAALVATGEGMFAEGDDLSEQRQAKKTSNRNWAMQVELLDADCNVQIDQATCEALDDDVVVDLIADGGDYGEEGASAPEDYLVVGTATFTPSGSCIWTEPEV